MKRALSARLWYNAKAMKIFVKHANGFILFPLACALCWTAQARDFAWTLEWRDDGETRWQGPVAAEVPGNCQLDLMRAGLLPDLEKGTNVLAARRYEGCDWRYRTTFARPALQRGERAVLRFGGIDTLGEVSLNGKPVGKTANMFVEHVFDVTDVLRDGDNALEVVLRSVQGALKDLDVGESGFHMGCGDLEPIRKQAHAKGWDIYPRLMSAGLWRPVTLETRPAVRIEDAAWIFGNFAKDFTSCRARAAFKVVAPAAFYGDAEVRLSLVRDGRVAAERTVPLDYVLNSFHFPLPKPELWWPRGTGRGQPLYEARIEIVRHGQVVAADSRRVGVRLVELVRRDVTAADPGEFLFKVNGVPIFVRGTNWVNLDALPARAPAKMLQTLESVCDLGCNLVRVWGGGVYEPDAFYEFCDARGLMVWQDFMFGCTVYPQGAAFAAAAEAEARAVVKRLRNHPSIVVWAGDNENDEAHRWTVEREFVRDPNEAVVSRSVLPRVVGEYDVTRPYLPSSPYFSPAVARGEAKPSEMHLWGARMAWKVPYYTNSPCHFASEIGYHGCPCAKTLETAYVHPGKLEHMARQQKAFFGEVPEDRETFSSRSQFLQAEALKTFIERFRADKFARKSGIVWWNVRDGWPIVSGAMIESDGSRKLAYYAIREVQKDVLVTVLDDGRVMAINDLLAPVSGHCRVAEFGGGRVLFEGDFSLPANATAELGRVRADDALEISWRAGDIVGRNHFLPGACSEMRRYLNRLPQLSGTWLECGSGMGLGCRPGRKGL